MPCHELTLLLLNNGAFLDDRLPLLGWWMHRVFATPQRCHSSPYPRLYLFVDIEYGGFWHIGEADSSILTLQPTQEP